MKIYQKSRRKKLFVALGIFLAAAVVFGVLEVSGKTSVFLDKQEVADSEAKTTSEAPTAQADFTGGDDREPNTNDRSSEATVSDGRGNVAAIPPQNQWATSPNGAISVYTPGRNAVVANGSTISGKASSSTVSFRLIDNVSGVIGQGTISVVNGSFSGTFNFSTSATEGRIDVFNSKPDGTEINSVEVPIRFR